MNKEEHLLVCLMEEASELQKEVSKHLRFGNNKVKIINEYLDLYTIMLMLIENKTLNEPDMDVVDNSVKQKKKKVNYWMKQS